MALCQRTWCGSLVVKQKIVLSIIWFDTCPLASRTACDLDSVSEWWDYENNFKFYWLGEFGRRVVHTLEVPQLAYHQNSLSVQRQRKTSLFTIFITNVERACHLGKCKEFTQSPNSPHHCFLINYCHYCTSTLYYDAQAQLFKIKSNFHFV